MSKISNKGQFSQLFKGSECSKPMNEYSTVEQRQQPDYTCNLPKLTSQSWVTVKNRQKGQPLQDTGNYKVKRLFGNVWVEVGNRQNPIIKKQKELMKQLRTENKARILAEKERVKKLNDVVLPSSGKTTTVVINKTGQPVFNTSKREFIDLSNYKRAVNG